jgi:hypothetical protein
MFTILPFKNRITTRQRNSDRNRDRWVIGMREVALTFNRWVVMLRNEPWAGVHAALA